MPDGSRLFLEGELLSALPPEVIEFVALDGDEAPDLVVVVFGAVSEEIDLVCHGGWIAWSCDQSSAA